MSNETPSLPPSLTPRAAVREGFLQILRVTAHVEREMGIKRGPGAAEDYLAVEQEVLQRLDQWARDLAHPTAEAPPEAA